jgi:uncharacterized protein with PhoU and TrkA domain
MKDLSSLILDLAYSAVLFDDEDLYEEVQRLEQQIDYKNHLLEFQIMLAVRNVEQAEDAHSLLHVAAAANRISDAAADIGSVIRRKIGFPRVFRETMQRAAERVARVRVRADSPLLGFTIFEIMYKLGTDIIAIERHDTWLFRFSDEFRLQADDVLLTRASNEAIEFLREAAKGEFEVVRSELIRSTQRRRPMRPKTQNELSSLEERIVKMITMLKDRSEVMVDLAYSSLLFGSKILANQVQKLEEVMDQLHIETSIAALDLLTEVEIDREERKRVYGIIRLVTSLEEIGDAASTMAELVLGGLDAHPLLKHVVDTSDETINLLEAKDPMAFGKTIHEFETGFGGIWVVSLLRGNELHVDPADDFPIEKGDILTCKVFEEGRSKIKDLVVAENH